MSYFALCQREEFYWTEEWVGGEAGRNENETLHHVTLTKGFWMLETEVTQKMWQNVMGSNPSVFSGTGYWWLFGANRILKWCCELLRWKSHDAGNYPVESVSWNECQEFCRKLSLKSGMTIKLPTEAQWEYACRAGTTTALNSGKNLMSAEMDANMAEVGRYLHNQSDGKGGYSEHTKVGSYLPNAWGLYDMHGNLWEWCLDWWGASTTSTEAETDPVGFMTEETRILRGGGYSRNAYDCRSATRIKMPPATRYGDDSFRHEQSRTDARQYFFNARIQATEHRRV